MYFDDVLVATFTINDSTPYRANTLPILALGRVDPNYDGLYMTVEIAELSLWTPELTFAQIQQL